MQIKSLTLKNFRGFKDTEITFSEGLTVLVGVNGAGKSSVLDALAMMLSRVASRIVGGEGLLFLEEADTYSGAYVASAGIQLDFNGHEYGWRVTTPGRNVEDNEPARGENDLTLFLDLLGPVSNETDQGSVPIFVHYPSSRAVHRVALRNEQKKPDLRQTAAWLDVSGVANFDSFFEWYKVREDLENESIKKRFRAAQSIRPTFELDYDSELEMVRRALSLFLPEITGIEIDRREMAMIAQKRGKEVRLDQLSDGEKCLIAIVGDIARRLSLANPSLVPRTEGKGVVLIDEIELHLHPAWQRTVIGNLRRTFPNVQFIVSTHSPQVLGEVSHEDIRILDCDPELGQQAYLPSRSLGLDSSAILEEIFHTGRRRDDVSRKLTSIFDLIDADSFDLAMAEIEALENELGANIPELIEARTMIAMLGGVGAEHR